MMNILFLAPRIPLPADTGGKIRTLNILKQLSQKASVTLLAFTFEDQDKTNAQELMKLGITVEMVPMSTDTVLQKITGVLLSRIPYSIRKYASPEMEQKFKELTTNNHYDAIHIDHLHMAHYISSNIPSVLDEHNVEYKILERCVPVERSLMKKLVFQNQTSKMKDFETQALRKFYACTCCSNDDKDILDNLSQKTVPVHSIPNGVDLGFFRTDKTNVQEMENSIVFTGSMDWLPNDDAITYFCDAILPLIWQKDPQIKLYVVGKKPSASVKKLSQSDPRVIVTGRVDDVRPYVERSRIFIVPLRIGGGTRLKILEAMSMRKAIVSTTIGAEGIECQDGLNIALADTPESFAAKIIELSKDPNRVSAMGQKGHELVTQKYDWNIIGEKLITIYKEAIHARRH